LTSFNLVTFIGNVGKDPELRKTPTDISVTQFSFAVDKYMGKDEDGKPVDTTMWLTVVAWRDLAEQVVKIVRKGKLVLVSGKLAVREYTDKENVKHTKVEIVASTVLALDKKPAEQPEAEVS